MAEQTIYTALHRYTEVDPDYYQAYEDYEPDVASVEQIRAIRSVAHVLTPSRYSCSDCARNIPKMTRIAEHLPGWTWEIFDSKDADRRAALGITRIPTFIVYDAAGGKELGRIVENPVGGSLEVDLLRIVQDAMARG
jgi:hypothetical protein